METSEFGQPDLASELFWLISCFCHPWNCKQISQLQSLIRYKNLINILSCHEVSPKHSNEGVSFLYFMVNTIPAEYVRKA
jgi:hypothetical protein